MAGRVLPAIVGPVGKGAGWAGSSTDDPAGTVIDAGCRATEFSDGACPRSRTRMWRSASRRCGASHGRASRRCWRSSSWCSPRVRSGEVRKAAWEEIDLGGVTWTVSTERMKGSREHRVPLSKRALEVLAQAAGLSDGFGLVFPGTRRRQRENPRSGAYGAKQGTSFHGTLATIPIREISSCQVIFVTTFAQLLGSAEMSPR